MGNQFFDDLMPGLHSHPDGGSHKEKYKDKNGEQLLLGVDYYGSARGTYRIIARGPYYCVVEKIASGRGVKIAKPKPHTLSNKWLRRIVYAN